MSFDQTYVTYIYTASKLNDKPVTFQRCQRSNNHCVREYGYKTVIQLRIMNETTKECFDVFSTKKNHVSVKAVSSTTCSRRIKNLNLNDSILLADNNFGKVISMKNIGYQMVYEYIGDYKTVILIDNVVFCNLNKYHKRTPISSYGIIAYRIKDQKCEFLLIQRKNTHGYTDFIRGRYYNRNPEEMLKIYINEMVDEERVKILSLPFDDLWVDLWLKNNKISRGEYEKAKARFSQINIEKLFEKVEPSKFSMREYGFPKGRRNRKEEQLSCAIREFQEETGLYLDFSNVVSKKITFEENFTGTNGIQYKHVYYLAKISSETRDPRIDSQNVKQCEEIRDVRWSNFEDAIRLFRHYDFEKKQVLKKAYEYISKKEFLIRDGYGRLTSVESFG